MSTPAVIDIFIFVFIVFLFINVALAPKKIRSI